MVMLTFWVKVKWTRGQKFAVRCSSCLKTLVERCTRSAASFCENKMFSAQQSLNPNTHCYIKSSVGKTFHCAVSESGSCECQLVDAKVVLWPSLIAISQKKNEDPPIRYLILTQHATRSLHCYVNHLCTNQSGKHILSKFINEVLNCDLSIKLTKINIKARNFLLILGPTPVNTMF